jgi:hypothetical protein
MKVTILSHYRSGIYWLIQILKKNLPKVKIYPEDNFAHLEVSRNPGVPMAVFLVRDGRDCLVSSYSCNIQRARNDPKWQEGKQWLDKSFKETLKWNYRKILNKKKEVINIMNPVKYWAKYNRDWLNDLTTKKIIVKYEDLHKDQTKEVLRIRRFYNLPEKKIEEVGTKKSCSFEYKPTDIYTPRNPGNWKKIFDEEDNEYFWSIAGEVMERLGYEKRV